MNCLDQLAEARAEDDDIGGGESERQPFGRRIAALGRVRLKRVVTELRDGKPAARMRRDLELDKRRVAARPDGRARRLGLFARTLGFD